MSRYEDGDGGIMDTTESLSSMIRELEKRVNEVERVIGALTEISAKMETAVELLVEGGLIDRQHLGRRADHTVESDRKRLSPYGGEELQRMWESMLDEQLETLDEAEMGHA
jgi:hypothetical protein